MFESVAGSPRSPSVSVQYMEVLLSFTPLSLAQTAAGMALNSVKVRQRQAVVETTDLQRYNYFSCGLVVTGFGTAGDTEAKCRDMQRSSSGSNNRLTPSGVLMLRFGALRNSADGASPRSGMNALRCDGQRYSSFPAITEFGLDEPLLR